MEEAGSTRPCKILKYHPPGPPLKASGHWAGRCPWVKVLVAFGSQTHVKSISNPSTPWVRWEVETRISQKPVGPLAWSVLPSSRGKSGNPSLWRKESADSWKLFLGLHTWAEPRAEPHALTRSPHLSLLLCLCLCHPLPHVHILKMILFNWA